MRKRRVYQMMCLLDEEELKQFKSFLLSPLLGNSKANLEFFELWEERVLQTEGEVSVEELFAGSRFQESRMDKLCSALYQKLLDFMAFLEYRDSERLHHRCAQAGLKAREAPSREFRRQVSRHQKWLARQKESAERQLDRLSLEWEVAEQKAGQRRTDALWKEDFQKLHDLLDGYYHLQKLKLACASENARHLFKQGEGRVKNRWRPLLDLLQAEHLSVLERAYFHTLYFLSDPTQDQHFNQQMDLLEANATRFELADARELYNYALNHTIRKGNQGEGRYWEHTGRLYRDLLDKDLLLVEGRLPSQAMKNIVVIHCNLGHLDWVAGFMRKYQGQLPPDTNPALVTYNRSVLAFYQADYPRCIAGMKEVVNTLKDDIFYEMDARVYLWKSWYASFEQLGFEELDEMERLYDSFRVLINRNNKISETHKLQYRNFIRAFKRLMVLAQMADPPLDQLEGLRADLESSTFIYNRDWLLEQAEALLSGK